MNGSTVRKKPFLPVLASGQLLGSPLAETDPRAEQGPGGKTTPHNIFFRPVLPKFEEIFEIMVGDFERCSMLPVRKTACTG